MLRATSGWLECSDPVLLGLIGEQNAVAGALRAKVADVDRWLALLIDPAGRSFEERELRARFGYPAGDLLATDADEC